MLGNIQSNKKGQLNGADASQILNLNNQLAYLQKAIDDLKTL